MRKNVIILAFAFISITPLPAISQSGEIMAGKGIATVQTEYGAVRGYVRNGISAFKGIPYAKAERFTAPQKPASWTGVRSSMTYGPVCPTDVTTTTNDEFEFPFHHDWGFTNENCLNLNVWSKETGTGAKKPVMVWFHGGGFTAGSSVELPSYDGENLAKKDVVVVSVNHRLNILGFLDMSAYGEKYKSSGNVGMMDLVAALQWVHENIDQFGGDPNNVTIFGQSGGGGKVTTMMYAPSAKGLFHKAIVESGSYLTGFTDPNLSKRISAALLEDLGLQPGQADSLQRLPYDVLYAAGKKAIQKVQKALRAENPNANAFGIGWNPVQDGSFLPYQPTDAAGIELAKNVPLLVGSTKNEFTPFIPGTRGISLEDAKTNLTKRYKDKTDAYMAAVLKAYPETVKPADYIDIDINFRANAIKQADAKAIPGAAPVYMYLFTWQSPVNDTVFKAMHCMEIPFVFNNIQRCEEMTGGGKEAYTLAEKMSNAWVAFAKTGNPNAKGLPSWPAYMADKGATMIFDTKCVVKDAPDKELLGIATAK